MCIYMHICIWKNKMLRCAVSLYVCKSRQCSVAVLCSMLQGFVVCFSMLQCGSVSHHIVSQCAGMCHSVLPYVAVIICHTKQVYFVS